MASYVRDIAVYIIFASVLEFVLPDNKFKEYVNLVTGLILIYIIASPIGNAFDSFKVPSALSYELDKSILQKEQAYYEEKHKEIILEDYKNSLYEQLEEFSNPYGTLIDVDVDVSSDYESFGEIRSISMIIAKKETGGKKKFIRIEKVSIRESVSDEEGEEVKRLRNAISDFYNLSVDNIHIIVQKKDG